MDERRGELGPLAHALRVGAHRAVARRRSSSTVAIARSVAGRGVRHTLEVGVEPDELRAGQVARHRLALRDEAHVRDRRTDRRTSGRPVDPGGAGRRARAARTGGAAGSTCRRRSVRAARSRPGPRANEMSLTATTLPYQRETWSSSMAGAGGRRRCSAVIVGAGARTTGAGAGDRPLTRDPEVAAQDEHDARQVSTTPRRCRSSRAGLAATMVGLGETAPNTAAFTPSMMSLGLARTQDAGDIADGELGHQRHDDRRDDEHRDDRGRGVGPPRGPGGDDRRDPAEERGREQGDDEVARDLGQVLAQPGQRVGGGQDRADASGSAAARSRSRRSRGTGRRPAPGRSRRGSGRARSTAAATP